MGEIISSQVRSDGKIVFEVLLSYEEATQLKGQLSNVYLLSENVAEIKSNIAHRGKNESTKYFLIPKELRKNLKLSKIPVGCQKIETNSKHIFVYIVDKHGV